MSKTTLYLDLVSENNVFIICNSYATMNNVMDTLRNLSKLGLITEDRLFLAASDVKACVDADINRETFNMIVVDYSQHSDLLRYALSIDEYSESHIYALQIFQVLTDRVVYLAKSTGDFELLYRD